MSLSYTDVIEAFNGAVESDFATNSKTGRQIIEREIQLAQQDLYSVVDPNVLNILKDGLPYHLFTVNTGDTIELLGNPVDLDIRLYESGPNYIKNDSEVIFGYNKAKCNFDYKDYTQFTDYTVVDNVVTIGTVETDTIIAVSYKSLDFSIPSLENKIKNKVCCMMGYQLFSAGDQTWALVDRYCELDKEFTASSSGKKFVPSELKLNYIESPFSYGMFGIKSRRVS